MTILGKAENALWSEFPSCSISSFTEAMSQACRRRSSFHSTLSKPQDVIVHSSLLGPEITSPAWQRHRGAGTLAEAPCVASDGLFFSGVTATLKKQLRHKCIPFCSLVVICLIDKLYFVEQFYAAKSSRKFREFSYVPCPYIGTPHCHIWHQMGHLLHSTNLHGHIVIT